MDRVGFIGLGAMGRPMSGNVMKAGFPLTVWARRPESADELRAAGAGWADSPGKLAAMVDVLILCVTNSPDVEALVSGTEGILTGASKNLIVVDMSTIAPEMSRSLAERCQAQGVRFLDAPVSGGTVAAESGTLSVMVGGEAEALARARPVLEAMGRKIFHVGPSGSGEVIKLVNNVLAGAIAAATAEALVLGAKAGADVATMAEVIGASSGASWQLSNHFPRRAFSGTFEPGFMTDLLVKDLGLALDLGADSGAPLFLTALARQLYGVAQAAGFGRCDYTSLLRVLESAAGTSVRTS